MATSTIEKVTNDSGTNSNGYYCKMPDGTLIQRGTTGNIKSGNTIMFPMRFLDNSYQVSITPQYNATSTIRNIYGVSGSNKYTDGFTLYVWDTGTGAISTQSNVVVEWIAIGRWK